MNEVPYLLRGAQPVTTQSSTLISSSRFLNHPRLRAWMATIALKRNGPDMLPQSEMYEVPEIINGILDHGELEERFTAERRINPELDAWFADGHISNFTAESMQDCPDGSLGHRFYRDVIQANYALVIYDLPKPKTQYEYWNYRAGQLHDFEHILTGGDFNYMGELVPNWARITTVFKYLHDRELAGQLLLMPFCAIQRYTIRTLFNYPEVWPVCQDAIERGMRVGHASEAYIFRKVEDAFHLPLEEARAYLGVRGAVDVDTGAASRKWAERE